MGALTLRALSIIAFASVAWVTMDYALAQTDQRIKMTLEDLESVMAAVSQSVIAGLNCDAGDTTAWIAVVSMIDNRQTFCVKQDPEWADLDQGWEREKEEAKQRKMVQVGVGGYAFIRAMSQLSDKIRSTRDMEAFCASMPWKLLIIPGAATVQARQQLARTRPGFNVDDYLEIFKTIRSWGTNLNWANLPCDVTFLSATFPRQK